MNIIIDHFIIIKFKYYLYRNISSYDKYIILSIIIEDIISSIRTKNDIAQKELIILTIVGLPHHIYFISSYHELILKNLLGLFIIKNISSLF